VDPEIICNQISPDGNVDKMDLVSDASVFVGQCKAAMAF
jgi:hypothetical protein